MGNPSDFGNFGKECNFLLLLMPTVLKVLDGFRIPSQDFEILVVVPNLMPKFEFGCGNSFFIVKFSGKKFKKMGSMLFFGLPVF